MSHYVVVTLTGFSRVRTVGRIVVSFKLANKALDGFTDIDTFMIGAMTRFVRSPRVGWFGPFTLATVEERTRRRAGDSIPLPISISVFVLVGGARLRESTGDPRNG